MKNVSKILILLFMVFTSCSEEFLDNPPEDRLVIDNFFNTDSQVLSSGAALYGTPWFYFNEKFALALDSYGGNCIGSYSDLAQFVNFSITGGNQFAAEGWDSLFSVVAFSNTLLHNLDTKVGENVDPSVIETVRGEAYFMRAVAYFYLVRVWGAVPILDNIEQYTSATPIYRNTIEDVYRFIIRDLEWATARLPESWGSSEAGRVTKNTCHAILSKIYITLKDYANAKLHAETVINSGKYRLLEDYSEVFHPKNNNSEESIFALQWIACVKWGIQNTNQAYLAPLSKITNVGDGWGSFQPSIDLQSAYEEGDLRRKATVMLPGDFYPELVTSEGGLTIPESGVSSTIGGFRKYVVGSPNEWANVCFMSTDNNTHIIRYADVLLIYAEAILAGADSTSDMQALDAFNSVRSRAGLEPKASITQEDIFKERRIEFVLEADYWFDLKRMDRANAIQIISNQERGENYGDPDNVNSKKVTPSANDFEFPIPTSDADMNPNLLLEPVPYDFDNN